MVALNLFLLCIFTISVSAFYPYLPEYKCVEDGSCLKGLTGRETPSGIPAKAPEGNGIFKIKIEQTPPADDIPLSVRATRYADRLARQQSAKRDNGFAISKSDKPTTPNSNAIDQDGTDFSYTTTVYVGSNNKPLRMLVDSGAASSWVMGSTCTKPACKIHNTFGPADSTTYKESTSTFNLEYGTGIVSGQYVTDTIGLAGFSLPINLGVADDVSDDFNNYPMDGILGLARFANADVPGFVSSLIDKKLLASNIFSVNIYRAADQANDGEITFGGVDSTKYTGDITYTDIVTPGSSWVIPVGEAGFNGQDSGLKGKTAIIDTGTTYCFIPPDDAKSFYATLPDAQVSSDGTYYSVPCTTTASAEFTFSGVTFSIPAEDWVGGKVSDTECMSNIFSREATQDGSWLLGDTFLKSVYAVFDLDQNRIGLATKPAPIKPASTSSTATNGAAGQTQNTASPTSSTPTSPSDNSSPAEASSVAGNPTGTSSGLAATMTTGSQGFNAIAGSSSITTNAPVANSAAANSAPKETTTQSSASPLLNTRFTLYIAAFIAAVAMVL